MKKRNIFLFLCCMSTFTTAQEVVYQLFQEKCVSCHSDASPEAGLDLEGAGNTEEERILSVRNSIVCRIKVKPVSPRNRF